MPAGDRDSLHREGCESDQTRFSSKSSLLYPSTTVGQVLVRALSPPSLPQHTHLFECMGPEGLYVRTGSIRLAGNPSRLVPRELIFMQSGSNAHTSFGPAWSFLNSSTLKFYCAELGAWNYTRCAVGDSGAFRVTLKCAELCGDWGRQSDSPAAVTCPPPAPHVISTWLPSLSLYPRPSRLSLVPHLARFVHSCSHSTYNCAWGKVVS